jgi:hypothetical protein
MQDDSFKKKKQALTWLSSKHGPRKGTFITLPSSCPEIVTLFMSYSSQTPIKGPIPIPASDWPLPSPCNLFPPATSSLQPGTFPNLAYLFPEDQGSTLIWNTCTHLPQCMVSQEMTAISCHILCHQVPLQNKLPNPGKVIIMLKNITNLPWILLLVHINTIFIP